MIIGATQHPLQLQRLHFLKKGLGLRGNLLTQVIAFLLREFDQNLDILDPPPNGVPGIEPDLYRRDFSLNPLSFRWIVPECRVQPPLPQAVYLPFF
jgi:hypothetical protein